MRWLYVDCMRSVAPVQGREKRYLRRVVEVFWVFLGVPGRCLEPYVCRKVCRKVFWQCPKYASARDEFSARFVGGVGGRGGC